MKLVETEVVKWSGKVNPTGSTMICAHMESMNQAHRIWLSECFYDKAMGWIFGGRIITRVVLLRVCGFV